jgi:hypothetical protein
MIDWIITPQTLKYQEQAVKIEKAYKEVKCLFLLEEIKLAIFVLELNKSKSCVESILISSLRVFSKLMEYSRIKSQPLLLTKYNSMPKYENPPIIPVKKEWTAPNSMSGLKERAKLKFNKMRDAPINSPEFMKEALAFKELKKNINELSKIENEHKKTKSRN